MNSYNHDKEGIFHRVCSCDGLCTATVRKTYFTIIAKELCQNESPSLGKSPSVHFTRADPLSDNTMPGQTAKRSQYSSSVIYDSDYSPKTYTMSHFLTCPYEWLSKDRVLSILCENSSWNCGCPNAENGVGVYKGTDAEPS